MLGYASKDPNVIGVIKSRQVQRLERVVEQASARGMVKPVPVTGADGQVVATGYQMADIQRFIQALGLHTT